MSFWYLDACFLSSSSTLRILRACCLLSHNGFAVLLIRLHLWAVFHAMPTLCSWCANACHLLLARVIRACFLLHRNPSSDTVVHVTVVLRHRALLDSLTLPLPDLLLSTTGASGCGSFSVLCSADVAFLRAACSSGGTLWSFTTVWSSVWYLQHHLCGTVPRRDRWFAVGTLASLCCRLQQRGPLSLRKFCSVWSLGCSATTWSA